MYQRFFSLLYYFSFRPLCHKKHFHRQSRWKCLSKKSFGDFVLEQSDPKIFKIQRHIPWLLPLTHAIRRKTGGYQCCTPSFQSYFAAGVCAGSNSCITLGLKSTLLGPPSSFATYAISSLNIVSAFDIASTAISAASFVV